MLDNYQKDCKEIKVPAHLKAETLLKMNAIEKKSKFNFTLKAVFAFCSIIIVSIVIFQWASDPYIKTALIEGKIVSKVELKDGELTFEENQQLKFFGSGQTIQRKINEQQAKKLIAIVPIDFSNATLQNTTYYGYYKGLSISFVEVVETYEQDNQNFILRYKKREEPIVTNSKVGDDEMFISYSKQGNMLAYTAAIQKNGMVYELTMNTKSQQQFIDLLIEFIKKIK